MAENFNQGWGELCISSEIDTQLPNNGKIIYIVYYKGKIYLHEHMIVCIAQVIGIKPS
jgi:hypothetical protein